ncbi:MAG TPA: hypothetical protein VFF43_05810 [Caldimonas sp.]|nr:hypothetical protein [Caldimonas sp.]
MSTPADRHPEPARLDALAVGERDDAASAHLDACDACARYVAALKSGAENFAREEAPKADRFVLAVRAREAALARSRRRAAVVAAGSTVLALAACVLLYVKVQHVPWPSGALGPVDTTQGSIRFKGGTQVNVIVDHGGAQSRRAGPLELDPEDRIRVEIALDHQAQVAAGVLADDGEWAELQAPATFAAGTRFSDRSVAFHGDVPSGWLLVGEPGAIDDARRTRDFADVIAIRVRQRQP